MSGASQDLGLGTFKQRSFERLDARGEKRRVYALQVGDLLSVEHCVLCGSRRATCLTEAYLEGTLKFFSTSACNDCLYIYRPASPSYQWFKKCWKQISTEEPEVFNPELEEMRKARYTRYRDLLARYVPKGSVLDVGAGYGVGSKVFLDRGYRMEAVEAEEDRARYAERSLKIPVHLTSIEEFMRGRRSYDLVILAHCLEHVDDPAAVMRGMRNLLDGERGVLYVEVPEVWSIVTWSDALYLAHKSNFTETNLLALVRRNGFEVLEKGRYQDTPEEPWNLGLVLRVARSAQSRRQESGGSRDGYGVEDIARLYRRKLPVVRIPPVDEVLRYSVPYIDHFYYTLRLDKHRVVEPAEAGGFISFQAV